MPTNQPSPLSPPPSSALFVIHFHIALRNILRHQRRSLLTVGAVATSVYFLVVFLALLGGLNQKMMDSALGLDSGTIQVHAAGAVRNRSRLLPLPKPEAIAEAFIAAGVTRFAPRLKAPALLLSGRESAPVYLSGIDPIREAAVTLIEEKMLSGSYQPGPGQILVSKELAQSFGLEIGKTLTIMSQGLFGQTRTGRFAICGFFATGLASFDQSHVYLSLSAAQTLLDAEGAISEMAARTSPAQAEELAKLLRQTLPSDALMVQTWREFSPDLAQLMELNESTFRLLTLILFLVAAMGIANTMSTVIFERFREFGTLSAMGVTPGGIIGLVLGESLLIGLFAALIGLAAAFATCLFLASHGINLAYFTSANQYFVAGPILKAVLKPGDFILAALVTLLTATAAGFLPAWKASRLNPIKALSHV